MQRHDLCSEAANRCFFLLELAIDPVQFRLSLRRRYTRFETTDHAEPVVSSRAVFASIRDCQRRPQCHCLIGKLKCARHHADDRVGLAVEHHSLTGDARIRAEPTLPESVAEDYNVVLAEDLFFGGEDASSTWHHTQHVENVGRCLSAPYTFGLVPAGDIEAH